MIPRVEWVNSRTHGSSCAEAAGPVPAIKVILNKLACCAEWVRLLPLVVNNYIFKRLTLSREGVITFF